MTGKLDGKVAVVTGSTAGIGRAIAVLFAAEGARVVVNGRRPEPGQATVEEIRAAGGTAAFFQADVSRPDELRALVSQAVDTYGGLDILVNNAWSGKLGTVLEVDEDTWDGLFASTLHRLTISCSVRALSSAARARSNSIWA